MREAPHSLEAEVSLIGGVLLDGDALDAVSSIVVPTDFYRQGHRWLWQVMLDLRRRGDALDVTTVTSELRTRSQLQGVGGLPYIASLTATVPTAANVEHYAEIVRDRAILRKAISVAAEVGDAAYSAGDVQAYLADAERQVLAIGDRSDLARSWSTAASAIATVWDEMMTAATTDDGGGSGISTGLSSLDHLIGGLRPAEVTVVAARPAMGKSALVGQLAMAVARQRRTVAFFSLEMTAPQLARRLLANVARVDSRDIRSGKVPHNKLRDMISAKREIESLPLVILDDKAVTIHALESRARRIRRKANLGLIVVDYIQLLKPADPRLPREQQIGEISRGLHVLAHELDCPVIALAQLNRSVEARADKRPMMSDLRESGSIEQDAHNILLLYRDDYYHEDSEDAGLAEVILAKQREGATGSVKLRFTPMCTRFDDLAHASGFDGEAPL